MTTTASIHRELRKGLRLTRGERLLVKRNRAQLTQQEMAAKLGVSRDTLRRWERDEVECPHVAQLPVTELTMLELFTLRRRRLGVTITYLADVMDMSVGWVYRAQTGEHDESAARLANLLMRMAERQEAK